MKEVDGARARPVNMSTMLSITPTCDNGLDSAGYTIICQGFLWLFVSKAL